MNKSEFLPNIDQSQFLKLKTIWRTDFKIWSNFMIKHIARENFKILIQIYDQTINKNKMKNIWNLGPIPTKLSNSQLKYHLY